MGIQYNRWREEEGGHDGRRVGQEVGKKNKNVGGKEVTSRRSLRSCCPHQKQRNFDAEEREGNYGLTILVKRRYVKKKADMRGEESEIHFKKHQESTGGRLQSARTGTNRMRQCRGGLSGSQKEQGGSD